MTIDRRMQRTGGYVLRRSGHERVVKRIRWRKYTLVNTKRKRELWTTRAWLGEFNRAGLARPG